MDKQIYSTLKSVNVLVIILIQLVLHNCFAQSSTFQLTFSNINNDIISSIKEYNNGYLLLWHTNVSTNQTYGKITKLDFEGNILSEVILTPDSVHNSPCELYLTDDESFMIFGFLKEPGENFQKVYVSKYNLELEIEYQKIYKTDLISAGNTSIVSDSDSNFYLFLEGLENNTNPLSQVYGLKFSNFGDSLLFQKMNFLNGEQFFFSVTSIPLTDDFRIAVWGTPYNNRLGKLVTMNNAFELLKIDTLPVRLDMYYNMQYVNDSVFVLTGREKVSDIPRDDDMFVAYLDNQALILTKTNIGKRDTIDYPASKKNLSFLQPNRMFCGYTKNFDPSMIYSSNISWMTVCLLDTNFNVAWEKFIGADYYYKMRLIEATSDGGCIVAGLQSSSSGLELLHDVVVYKMGSDGSITSVSENEKITHDAIVYPNPGSDFLNIEFGPQIRDAQFFLYDISGKKCFQTQLRNSQEKVQTTTMPSGVYLWHIQHSGKIVESGKWIKE